MSTIRPPLLQCRGIRKVFPGVVALDDVDLSARAGEVLAVVGENGAGKSTLMKILSGAHAADAGTIHIEEQAVTIRDARAAIEAGIAIVYQEFNLVDDLSVGENIFLGRWPRRSMGRVDFKALHDRSTALLGSLSIPLSSRQAVGTLSVAQQQMVEIAKALSQDARILILDEPSAVLTVHELDTLFSLIRDLLGRGVAIIYISHRLEEIFDLAKDVTVLRDGRHIMTRPVGEVSRAQLISAMVGRELSNEFPSRCVAIGETALTVEGICCGSRFEDVSFAVRRGEIFALTGLVGSGRSSVVRTLFGADRATAGRVQVGTHSGPFHSPRAAMAAGLASLPEDRKLEGLLLERSLRENLALANLGAHSRGGIIEASRERQAALRSIASMRIKAVDAEVAVHTLSGGNQQKALLGRWMDRPHQVMLFDEPTRGVDVGAKYEIYELMNALAAAGSAIVMVSSELPEVIGMADRIGVMRDGRLTGILDNSDGSVKQDHIMDLAAGARDSA
jgi:ABC-type sugar transport system ATPase subunit